MKTKKQNSEVLYAVGETAADRKLLESLAEKARRNPRRRIRLCAHAGPRAPIHEMLIVLAKGAYVRPHRHRGKVESYHVAQGRAELIEFDDSGTVRRRIPLGDRSSGRVFYYRNAASLYHMMLVSSAIFAFHETTNGPFDRSETKFAPWSPEEADAPGVRRFLSKLSR